MDTDLKYGELIIGIITTVGAYKQQLIDDLKDSLRKFEYDVEILSVTSEVIDGLMKDKPTFINEATRINYYMNAGNSIRDNASDNKILMRGIINKIYASRSGDEKGKIPGQKKAYIIDSIKHPDEVEILRDIYKDAFFLIGFTGDYEKRKSYLVTKKGLNESQAKEILARDEHEELAYGQHVRDAFQMADFFIMDSDNNNCCVNAVNKFVDLIFGSPFITPSFEEYAMFMAFASSLRTADLSRQVGAVVAKNNEVLASGTNDCPKFGGGLYWSEKDSNGCYVDEDNGRDYKLNYDPNKEQQAKIVMHILKSFKLDENDVNVQKIKDSGIGDLTEFGRGVHGEMEALLFCARNNISCRGADMYVTTFPCHNCAKHIIAAGIKKVVYIEPYPKSKALEFYQNEICMSNNGANKEKVLFKMFEGVGPQRFQDLFCMSSTRLYKRKRKDSAGKIVDWKRENAVPRYVVPLFNYIDMEMMEVMRYGEQAKRLEEKEMHNTTENGE